MIKLFALSECEAKPISAKGETDCKNLSVDLFTVLVVNVTDGLLDVLPLTATVGLWASQFHTRGTSELDKNWLIALTESAPREILNINFSFITAHAKEHNNNGPFIF